MRLIFLSIILNWQNSIQSRRIRYTGQPDYEDLLLEGIFARVALDY